MLKMISFARLFLSSSTPATQTRPSSSMSILTPVSSIILLIVFPPEPITSLILSGSIVNVIIFGAYLLNCFLGSLIASAILSRMNILPFLACSRAVLKMLSSMPLIFMSIWIAVIPFLVPATLKSMSPRKSSKPWMSVKTATLFDSVSLISPIAIPATGAEIGTPASISAKVLPQTLAWLVLPLLLKISLTVLIA